MTQEKARRAQQRPPPSSGLPNGLTWADQDEEEAPARESTSKAASNTRVVGLRPNSAASIGRPQSIPVPQQQSAHQKAKSSLSNLGRFTSRTPKAKK